MEQVAYIYISSIFLVLRYSAVILLLGCIYWSITYNGLTRNKNNAKRHFSGIDIQLKKRWDLIPELVKTVRAYSDYEAELLIQVTRSRNAAKASYDESCPKQRIMHEGQLSGYAPALLALAESYPDLKANQQYEMLQRNLTEVEAQISAVRRSYNASVLIYNNLIQSFPSNIIARYHGFSPMDFFSINHDQRQNVSI